jgi:signal peptidase I
MKEDQLQLISQIREDLIKEYLEKGKSINFHVSGKSMFPAIPSGSSITVSSVPENNIKPGDVLVFSSGSKYIAHRVLRAYPDNSGSRIFETKGDFNISHDLPLDMKNVIGKVTVVKFGFISYSTDSFSGKIMKKILTSISQHNSFPLRILYYVVRNLKKAARS